MKQEFTEVLLPPPPQFTSSPNSQKFSTWKRSAISAYFIIAILSLLILSFGILYRYEGKLEKTEDRLHGLETKIHTFLKEFEPSQYAFGGQSESKMGAFFEEDENLNSSMSDESTEEPEEENIVFGEIKITKEGGREKRQVPSYSGPTIPPNARKSQSGVPIFEGSYGSRPKINPTDSEGLRLYESFVATGGQGEPKAPEFAESDGTNLLPYHRTSAAWTSATESSRRRLEVKSGDEGRSRHTDNPFFKIEETPKRGYSSSSTASLRRNGGNTNTVINRNSRVPSTGEHYFNRKPKSNYPYPPLKKIGHGDGEDDIDEFSVVKASAHVETPPVIAAHFVADSSNFTLAHRHYEGNGRLRNADAHFSYWRPSDWMMTTGNDFKNIFSLAPNGSLTVRKSGLYYIYAQIHYLDSHDINGYVIFHNSVPLFQCTRMTETKIGATAKSNSCFTGGVAFIKENDTILIRDIEHNRYSILMPEKSFFGLMRIGEFGGR